MAQRLRLYDLRLSRLPGVVGLCQADVKGIARYANGAQQRLLYCKEAGDEGFWGSWAEIAFNVSRAQPYITLPREIARLEAVNVCNRPVAVQNQFYEYLEFGNGRLPKLRCASGCAPIRCLSRNQVPTFTDLSGSPQKLRLYPTDAADVGRRVLLQGLDNHGSVIYSQDVFSQVSGIFVTLDQPFVDAPMPFSRITGIQKDITAGPVKLFQVDPTSAVEVLLSVLEGGEETAWYRRYYLDRLPCSCCPPPGAPADCTTLQVTAIAKLEPIPVVVDTDYMLLQNIEAIIEEAQSLRYSEMDTVEAKQMSRERHQMAVGLLNGELNHFIGKNSPSVNFAPFGTARLEYQNIGMI